MKEKRKPNIFLRVALVLLCLVLLSTHFTAGLYARYTTWASGKDSGRLASFSVKAENLIIPDEPIVFDDAAESPRVSGSFQVSNPGESSVSYSVAIMIGEEDVTSACCFTDGSNGTGRLAPKAAATTHSFELDFSKVEDTAELSLNDADGKLPLRVVVTFTQVN